MLKSPLSRVLTLFLVCSLLACAALAQPGGITTGGVSQRPIFISGKVALDDGQLPPEKAEIDLVCQGQAQPQGKTDSKGGFGFELGANRFQWASDASVGSAAAGVGFGGALSGQAQLDGASVKSLMGCFLRAVLQGYRSESLDLSRVRLGDSPNVGTIILHKLADVQGVTVSATSLSAPKDAKKAVEKARKYMAKQQFEDAEKELNKAVQLHPKYAEAWQELGVALQAQKKTAEARKAYLESIASDAKFVKPYLNLARLSAVEKKWQDVLDKSDTLLRLDPYEYPQAYHYSAVAYYSLGNYDKAFDSAQRAVKVDSNHTMPLAEQFLGMMYSMRGDHKAAAEQFRNYLQHVPPTANVDEVKALLAEAEKRMAQSGQK
jgi:tetratricopeptide (TPR) repeat protein